MTKELAKTMKEPDLIYVAIDTPIEKRRDPEFVGLAWTKNDNSCKHVEYISKDALMEWASNMLGQVSDMGFDDGDVEHGYTRALQDVIDKINSL